MSDKTIYLKMDAKVKMQKNTVRIGDLGKIYCKDSAVAGKVKTLPVCGFQTSQQHSGAKGIWSIFLSIFQKADSKRCVIGILKVIQLIHREYPAYTVEIVGETECIVEQISKKQKPVWLDWMKIILVSEVCFLGTIYTIMSYHNEINIQDLFDQIYSMITGKESDGFTALEAAYSVGLSLGILIFYNHIGRRKLTMDPSPISVEMRTYEDDVNRALVEMANREEKTIDVN